MNPSSRQKTHFQRGRFYRLLAPVGPIPAGIYRCEGHEGAAVTFSAGKSRTISFALTNLTQAFASEVSFSSGKKLRIRRSEFMSSYFDALESGDHEKPRDPSFPRLSYCMMPMGAWIASKGEAPLGMSTLGLDDELCIN